LSGSEFKIKYDPDQIELINITGFDMTDLLRSDSAGELTFKVNKTIYADKKWSGIVSMLRFKAKVIGETMITFMQW
jgi:hypothetical protein